MISFPNAKINIGLNVLEKRSDGYHNIESIVYPIPLYDSLEILPSKNFRFNSYGKRIYGSIEDNLVVKAFRLIQNRYHISNISIRLIKNIPAGSGLGGGSSNASFTLKSLNELFELDLTNQELRELALEIGSDCPFFIDNQARKVSGRGGILEDIDLDLSNYHLLLITPEINSSTKEAFNTISISPKQQHFENLIEKSKTSWKHSISNDFQKPFFEKHPQLLSDYNKVKDQALFVSLSGTGSSFYGLFDKKERIQLENSYQWLQL